MKSLISKHLLTPLLAVGCVVAGCSGPVRVGPPLPGGLGALAANAPGDNAKAAESDPRNSPKAGSLAVNGEFLSPKDVWGGYIDNIRKSAATMSPKDLQRKVVQQSATLISDQITESLLYQKASLGLGDKAEPQINRHIDGEIRKIVTERFDGIQRRYEKFLEAKGRTLADVRRQLRRRTIIGAYLESDVRPRIAEPTRAEIYAAFEQQRESLRRPATRSMSLIDIRANKFLGASVTEPSRAQSDAAKQKALAEARAALAELRSGQPFAQVAREHSHGLHASDGGAWGVISRDAVRDRFLPAVDALQQLDTGEVSDVVETPDGFFVVCCDKATKAVEPDFVRVQPEILRTMLDRRYNDIIGKEVQQLRSAAKINKDDLARFHKRVVEYALKVVRENAH